jgi:RHS repeat-associated protein
MSRQRRGSDQRESDTTAGAHVPGKPEQAPGPQNGGRPAGERKIDIQRIAQPAAGAKVRGLSDMFEGPGQYGSAKLSVPIPVTAARGFEPELTLDYESGAGNGLFGQGVQVALSSVSRATNLHLPRYDGSDGFSLDGNLLALADAAPQTRSVAGRNFRVACYRPRVEASFQRIEYWRPVSGGPGFWRTLSREDEIAIYGSTPEARIADPADPSRVFEWLIEAHFDPRGEAIRYRYKAEDDANVPVTNGERGRSRDANRYPIRISYGSVAPFTPADPLTLPDGPFLFDVLFDYGECCVKPDNDAPATPVRPWACRLDSFSNYAAGFERRTHRLCRHILIVHHFRQELGVDDAVVKVMALDYDETPYRSLLVSIRAAGWWYQANRPQGRRYAVKTLPPLLLKWTELPHAPPAFTSLDIAAGTGLPRFGEPPPYALVDLDGSGLPGVLYADGATTAYVAPVLTRADVNAPVIYGSTPLPAFPIERIASDGIALADLDGDGRLSLSVSMPPLAGFYPRAEDGGWRPFRPYPFALTDAVAPQVESVDLTGDGRGDRLRVCSNELAYNPNLGRLGFDRLQRRERPKGLPLTAPPPPNEDVRFADVLGGGTVPAVLLRSGSLRCWPNLGYGRFGTAIDLAAPALPPNIGPDRVVFADLTGGGYGDFIIALTDRLVIHRNQSGNGFAKDAIEVMLPVPLRSMSQLRSTDMAGLGCQALVFTGDDPRPQHWVLDIAGGRRPGLVAAIDDGQGCVVRIAYASSARFQLLDRLEGRPWITALADPVFVVASVEQVDEIGGVTRVKDYRYSHGYYDAVEREFRGFGLVEIRERDAPRPTATQSVGDAPPLLVREWYHTGATPSRETLEEAFAREYWHGDDRAFPMPPSCFDWGQVSPDAETWRQAVAALAGTLLRRESFAAGDLDAPFSVDAGNALVRLEQPRIDDQAAVFLVTAREQMTSLYDCEATDPRITHDVNLEVDAWGDVVLACQVAYARRAGGCDIVPEQLRTWINAARSEFMPVRQGADLWLAGFPRQERRWTLPKLPPPTVRGLYYDFRTLRAAVESAIGPGGDGELLEWSRTIYVAEGGGEAPPGVMAPQALIRREETATFDPVELAREFLGAEPPGGLDAFLIAQAYRFDPDNGLWWNPGLTQNFAGAEGFFLPTETRDPFAVAVGSDGGAGTIVTYTYDAHRLMIVGTTMASTRPDVLPHVTEAVAVDYHIVAATSVRDPNQKTHEVLLDPLGDFIATSVYGWEWRDGSAVRTGFAPLPLDDPAQWPVPPDTGDLVDHASDYLGGAASFHFTDWHSWKRERQPMHTALVRARDYPTEQSAPPDITIDFIDGFGRPLQSKARTEPGQAYQADASVNSAAVQRWATTGGRHYNGLGLPDRMYEPYFTDHWQYTADPGLNSLGITLILHYDASGRLIRTDYPKGGMAAAFFSLIVYASWSETHWDRDDTVKASNYYRAHVDPGHEPLPPWEHDALVKAAAFDGTPSIDHFDARGLIVREEERLTKAGAPISSLVTLHEYDADGMEIAQADPLRAAGGKWNVRTTYDLAGDAVHTDSVDAGKRWALNDTLGNSAYTHDGRGISTIVDHDGYHRPIATQVWTAGVATPIVAERFIYGDSLDSSGAPPLAEPDRRNLMGALCVSFDGAGRSDGKAYALCGPVTDQTMRLASHPCSVPDWTAAAAPTWAALFAALHVKLQSGGLRTTARFNALADIVERSEPNGTRVKWRYQRPGLLVGVAASRDGEAFQDYLAAVEYNAKGQRISAQLKNADGALMLTEYRYDPDTFLLNGIITTRLADGVRLQDLTYWTDPIGNITHITDAAAPAAQVFHANQEVTPDQDFTYDSIYRLIGNKGRAHAAYTLAMAADGGYGPYFRRPSKRDSAALENYCMKYDYDDAGNLWRTRYRASNHWTQTLKVAPDSNRGAVTEGSLEDWFDHNGNQLKLNVGSTLAWTWADCLAAFTLVDRDADEPDAEYYCYDAAGMRKRKVTRRATAASTQIDETITMGDYTLHRRMRGETTVEEWCSTRVTDGDECIVELFDWIAGTPPEGVATRQDRYQLNNLIGSSVMEVSREGQIISYEEYAPYGITVYAAGTSLAEVSLKRFRFAGRRRDQATGLYYYGARYYAPWLGRWLSPDPAGDADGLNLYAFVGGNPVSRVDIGGLGRSQPRKGKGKAPKKTSKAPKKKTAATKKGVTKKKTAKTPKKTTKSTKTTSKTTKPKKSTLDRGTFNAAAKKKMEPDTDLAHRTSFDQLRDDIEKLRAGTMTPQTWKDITVAIVGQGDADLLQEIEDFSNKTGIDDPTAQTMLNKLNSALENLRPGDPRTNRRIKGRYDPGTEDSRTGRTSTRDPKKRARSVSPITREQVSKRLKLGEQISFYTPDQKVILASTHTEGFEVSDFEASITPSLGLAPGQQLTATYYDKRQKVRTYQIT